MNSLGYKSLADIPIPITPRAKRKKKKIMRLSDKKGSGKTNNESEARSM